MANFTFNGGFRPVGTVDGTPMPATVIREVANNYATALFQGDILIHVSDGTVAQGAAANNGLLAFVAVGFTYVVDSKRQAKKYVPANTTFSPTTVGSINATWVECMPITPNLLMEVDGNAAAPTPTVAGVIGLIGENCDLATTTGDTVYGQSTMTLDLSTHATTTANFRVFGLSQYPEGRLLQNDVTASRVKFLVTCNEGFWPPYTATGV
jgi:hypothetical protein